MSTCVWRLGNHRPQSYPHPNQPSPSSPTPPPASSSPCRLFTPISLEVQAADGSVRSGACAPPTHARTLHTCNSYYLLSVTFTTYLHMRHIHYVTFCSLFPAVFAPHAIAGTNIFSVNNSILYILTHSFLLLPPCLRSRMCEVLRRHAKSVNFNINNRAKRLKSA